MKAFREEAVDFTHPFMYLGLGALAYKGAAPRSLEQLAEDDSVKVGAFCCGATAAFFQTTTDPLYQKIYAKMQASDRDFLWPSRFPSLPLGNL